ncbi:hypothetical protein DEVEQU_01915 [Devosia equisanguinis]|uniref:DUF3828 domain-containing protein n=1 Tax=Devosia equisanguinis TaxID=2490941 RepID=A0A447IBL7_9HYPH|nr:hypothetical protein [Devosia equisanguinis]VDS04775.1 hypothetical protein DEVEQU_01915 [Devosia equisanguinis]
MLRQAAASLSMLAAASLPLMAAETAPTPLDIGAIFCTAAIAGDMSPIVPLLTPDLAATIADAQQRSDAIQAAAPDEKPPLGDGVPWSSWTDHADGCEVGVPKGDESRTVVPIGHRFADSPGADYTDRLLLVPVVVETGKPPIWRLDDIQFTDSTMRQALASAFEGHK